MRYATNFRVRPGGVPGPVTPSDFIVWRWHWLVTLVEAFAKITSGRTLTCMRQVGLVVLFAIATGCQFSENRYLARTVRAEELVGSWQATEFAIKSLRDVGVTDHLAVHEHTLALRADGSCSIRTIMNVPIDGAVDYRTSDRLALLLRRGRRPPASMAVRYGPGCLALHGIREAARHVVRHIDWLAAIHRRLELLLCDCLAGRTSELVGRAPKQLYVMHAAVFLDNTFENCDAQLITLIRFTWPTEIAHRAAGLPRDTLLAIYPHTHRF